MKRQKRAAAIHDISGFGKCSLTAALPIISAAGIETAAIPTAVLSTHTAFKPGFTCRDLTEDLEPFVDNWLDNGFEFDAVYSGFLGSAKQISIVASLIGKLSGKDTIKIVDPAMADNGKMYSSFDLSFAGEMARLCKCADVIVPNLTEAAFLLGREFRPGALNEEQTAELACALFEKCGAAVVLTGVSFDGKNIGAAVYAPKDGLQTFFRPRIPENYSGTGDVFASVLTAALIKGRTLSRAVQIAVDFTYECILRTYREYPGMVYGVDFEDSLYKLRKMTEED
ncbi:MAG: pyridoxamine kinase [Clostridia bacterium]|nr:pyridoxamine kinase [Clostridia bacterium]